MGIQLDKKVGINLKKGSTISLSKEDYIFNKISVGSNWGSIQRKGLFSKLIPGYSVDLDSSVAVFDKQGHLIDVVSYRKLISSDKSIKHSGDDLTGDAFGDDGIDNETITIDLLKIDKTAESVVFFLNSFKKQDFATIPYSKIKIYDESNKVFATFNLSSEPEFEGYVSMVMGKMYRSGKNWSFKTIGSPVRANDLDGTVKYIKENYV